MALSVLSFLKILMNPFSYIFINTEIKEVYICRVIIFRSQKYTSLEFWFRHPQNS